MIRKMSIRTICVFCGSRPGATSAYIQAAQALAKAGAERGFSFVYGGASVGVMGAFADSAIAHGAKVHGVIPESLQTRELGHPGLSALEVTPSMHTRKARMAELADAFVALPGGFGTYDELFEVLTWAQIGIHNKPIGLLNVDGFYDGLLAFVDHATSQGFVDPAHRVLLTVSRDPAELLSLLDVPRGPAPLPSWQRA
jgi:uncharacterized protein (TIGR00730 family)